MTLIALLQVNGVNVLMGDLLVSTPVGALVCLPTVGFIHPGEPDKWGQPAGLAQKIVLIGQTCALA
jgi:hypothetical protein